MQSFKIEQKLNEAIKGLFLHQKRVYANAHLRYYGAKKSFKTETNHIF